VKQKTIFKRIVNNVGVKLCNKLPNYIKNLENVRVFRKQFKAFFLLQQAFYSIDKYLSYECATGKVGGDDEKRIYEEREIL
jgi:hypothetical protein